MPLPVTRSIETFYERMWNAWDDSAVDDTLAESFEFRGSLGQRTVGRDGWRGYRDSIRAGSSDFHNELVDLVCEGRRAAARLRYSGTHTGQLLGLSATGRHFEYDGAAFFLADHQRLVRAWVLGDVEGLRKQLS